MPPPLISATLAVFFYLCSKTKSYFRHLLKSLGDNFTDSEFDELTTKAGKNGKFEFNQLYNFVQN